MSRVYKADDDNCVKYSAPPPPLVFRWGYVNTESVLWLKWCRSFLYYYLSSRKSSTDQQTEKPDIPGRLVKKANIVRFHQQAEKAGVVLTWLEIHLSQLSAVLLSQPICQLISPFFVYDMHFSFPSAYKPHLFNSSLSNMVFVIAYEFSWILICWRWWRTLYSWHWCVCILG